jgi:hypothetical protein
MSRFEGTLARKLDFGDWPTMVTSTGGRVKAGLRLAPALGRATGPDKYRVLEHRRRRAQMNARHLLGRLEEEGRRGLR